MKIYQINVVCGYGSTGRIVVDLYNAIMENGGECRIAYGRGEAPKNVNALKISNKVDLYFHATMTRLTDKHALFSKSATKKLIKDIKRFSPDVIHLHNIHGYYLNYKILFNFLKEYNKPVVWTMHDCWAFTGHCAHYSPVGCVQWRNECKSCKLLRTYPETLCKGNVVSNFQNKKDCFSMIENLYIVTPSEWLKEQLEQSFLKNKQVSVINNGIDVSQFQYISPEKLEKKRILGVASTWNKEKGLDDIYELRKLLPEEYEICLIGLNDAQIKSLPEGIVGVSRTNSIRELAEYYSSALIFLNLTYADTFPTVNMEALACGIPILTYDVGGSPEIVGDCGWIVPKGDIEQVKEILLKYEQNNDMRKRCISRAKGYTQKKCYDKYMQLYKDICNEI